MRALFADKGFAATLGACLLVTLLLGAFAGSGPLTPYVVNAVGQLAAFAILAVSLDLIWGYLGILSLGHGLFFAIGGYVAAMHLLKHSYEVTHVVPDFMQFMGWREFPVYWAGLEHAPYALILGLGLAAFVAFVFGYVSFRSKVGGVYFAIISQALVYVAMLLMFRNDTGFGGNNGMTGFSLVFGWPMGAPGTLLGLALASLVALAVVLVGCRLLVTSRVGRLMVATRDDEVRLRSLGFGTLWLKLAVWCLSAVIAALAGMLYVPQVGIINPRVLAPELSIEIAVWVAVGGRGYLSGAVIGAFVVNALKFWLSAAAPEAWPFILSGLVVLVVLVFPNGLLDIAGLNLRPRRFRTVAGPAR
jgi:urea transport system permease protein